MRKFWIVLAIALSIGFTIESFSFAGPAFAQSTKRTAKVSADIWNEENCKQMCRRTRGATSSEVGCYHFVKCEQFRGKPSATQSEVDRRVARYCSSRVCPFQNSR